MCPARILNMSCMCSGKKGHNGYVSLATALLQGFALAQTHLCTFSARPICVLPACISDASRMHFRRMPMLPWSLAVP